MIKVLDSIVKALYSGRPVTKQADITVRVIKGETIPATATVTVEDHSNELEGVVHLGLKSVTKVEPELWEAVFEVLGTKWLPYN